MKIIFRADSSIQIGYGHIIRCLTIANYLSELGHQIIFYILKQAGCLEDVISNKGYALNYVEKVDEIISERSDWLVIDHYQLDKTWEIENAKYASNIFVIDDLNRDHSCNALLDMTYGKVKNDYDKLRNDCEFFVGGNYPVLRKDIISLREDALIRRENTISPKKLLINIGGTDHLSITKEVLLKVITYPDLEVSIILSEKSKCFNDVKSICERYGNLKIYPFIEDIAKLIIEVDFAIGAAGVSTYERACLGLPTILIQTADNQKFNINAFSRNNMALTLHHDEIDKLDSLIRRIREKSTYKNLVNLNFSNIKPLGFFRVLERIHKKEIFKLRNATQRDIDQVYKWQSYPSARKFSRNKNVPKYDEHVTWFKKTLKDKKRKIFILEAFNISLGLVRIDPKEEINEVSILISHGHYGQGLGSKALSLLRQKMEGLDLYAYIEERNKASQNIFIKNGYSKFKQNWYINKA